MNGIDSAANTAAANAIADVFKMELDVAGPVMEKLMARLEQPANPLQSNEISFFDHLASKASTSRNLYSDYGSDWTRTAEAEPLSERELCAITVFFLVFADTEMIPEGELAIDRSLKFLNAGLRTAERCKMESVDALADTRISQIAEQCRNIR